MKKYIICFSILILFVALIIRKHQKSYFITENNFSVDTIIDSNITCENKGGATISESQIRFGISIENPNIPEQMLNREGYVVSYNKNTKCANWVAWVLTKEHTKGPFSRRGVPYYDEYGNVIGIGEVSRYNNDGVYFVDVSVPSPRQEIDDWKSKPFQISHGHLCPAGDNKWSKAAMNQSFFLTNMCPQDKDLNNGDWKSLEELCRKWANMYDSLYVVAGPIFYNENVVKMGTNQIWIPDGFFKVVLRIGVNLEAIGFLFPNNGQHHELSYYIKTVDYIEEITQFDFFRNLSDEIEQDVEGVVDLSHW